MAAPSLAEESSPSNCKVTHSSQLPQAAKHQQQHLPLSPPASLPLAHESEHSSQKSAGATLDATSHGYSDFFAPVNRVLHGLRQLKHGRGREVPTCGYTTFALGPAHFAELHRCLSADRGAEDLWHWYCQRARYDYDAYSEQYTLRMPTAVHECFTASVVSALDRAVANLVCRLSVRKGDGHAATAVALKRVFKGASTTVELDGALHGDDKDVKPDFEGAKCQRRDSGIGVMPVRRSPDASYYHHDAGELPQVVIEVSYSQQRRHLARLAESYIVDSRHAIRCVIGLDIPYSSQPGSPAPKPSLASCHTDHTATVSVWRAAVETDEDGDEVGVCRCDVDAVMFRDACNMPCKGALELSLADFLPPATLDRLPKSAKHESICISFADLAAFIDSAEQCQATMAVRPSRTSPMSTLTKFRKRKRTPSIDLSDERELTFLRQEVAELEKDLKSDRCWRSPSKKKMVSYPLEPRRSPRNNKVKVKAEGDGG